MLPHRPLPTPLRVGVGLAVGLLLAHHLIAGHLGVVIGPNVVRLDLDVYRLGGQVWLAGQPLYGPGFPVTSSGTPLPFTYPPLAAVLFAPLALVPLEVASGLWTALSIGLVLAVAVFVLRRLGHRIVGARWWWAAAWIPVVLVLEPVRGTLGLGQINVLLLAVVCADCLLPRTPWPRGMLVGLVAAVKLTPAVFLLYFLVRGDRRALVTGAVALLAGTAVGFLLAPGDSVRYWTATLFETDRIGSPWYAANQNLDAVLLRLGAEGFVATVGWVAAAAAVTVLAAVAARRAVRAGEPMLALVLVALAGLLASPVSWSHHWVWCVPALIVLWDLRAHPTPRALAVAGLGIFLVAPYRYLPAGDDRELSWSLWQQAVGATGVVWALVVLGAAAVGVDRWAAARSGRPTPAGAPDGELPLAVPQHDL